MTKRLLLIPVVAVVLIALSTIASGHGRPGGY